MVLFVTVWLPVLICFHRGFPFISPLPALLLLSSPSRSESSCASLERRCITGQSQQWPCGILRDCNIPRGALIEIRLWRYWRRLPFPLWSCHVEAQRRRGDRFTFSVGSGIESACGDGMQNRNRINSSERSSCAQTTVLEAGKWSCAFICSVEGWRSCSLGSKRSLG